MSTDNTAAELKIALDMLEKEKEISRDVLFDAIEGSLLKACANHFGKSDNFKVDIDRETCEYHVYVEKTVVMEVTDPAVQISKAEAKEIQPGVKVGDIVRHPKFGEGMLIEQDEKTMTVIFDSVGQKKLGKGYVKMEKVE